MQQNAERLAWAKGQAQQLAERVPLEPKAVSYDRRIPFHADAIDSIDLVIAGIDAGAQRAQVISGTPCAEPQWKVIDAAATQDLNSQGWPNGWFYVTERTRCQCCGRPGVRGVPGCRARSAAAAMDAYRARTA